MGLFRVILLCSVLFLYATSAKHQYKRDEDEGRVSEKGDEGWKKGGGDNEWRKGGDHDDWKNGGDDDDRKNGEDDEGRKHGGNDKGLKKGRDHGGRKKGGDGNGRNKGGDDDDWKKRGDDDDWKKGGNDHGRKKGRGGKGGKKGGGGDGGKKGGGGKGGGNTGGGGGGGAKGQTWFDVTKYGAKGDGRTLDSSAFLKAWEDVCSSNAQFPVLGVPKRDFILNPIEFNGPCNAPAVGFQLYGNLISSPEKSHWSKCEDFISFHNVNNLDVSGSGVINGNGQDWWDNKLSCGKRPTNLGINSCKGVSLSNIFSKNSARNHISISHSESVTISDITLTAPDKSPNTDGIDISSSSAVIIQNSKIGSGDDCVAINTNSKDITIKGVKCGPGHGISVGSLGKNGQFAKVENVLVEDCTFTNTDNGARIKTWKGGRGYVKNVIYRNIKLENVRHPIIIDQNYVNKVHSKPLSDDDGSSSSVQISDVQFINFSGTCQKEDAITLNCASSGSGCNGVSLENVVIEGSSGQKPQATCQNANLRAAQSVPPIRCRQNVAMLDYSEHEALAENDLFMYEENES